MMQYIKLKIGHEPHTGGHDSTLEDEDEDEVTETCLPVQVAGKHTVL